MDMCEFLFKLSNSKCFLDQILAAVLCLAVLTANAAPQGFGGGGLARVVGDAVERGVQNAAENILQQGSRGFGGRDYDSGFGSGGNGGNGGRGFGSDGNGGRGFDNNGYNSGGYNNGGFNNGGFNNGGIVPARGILNPLGFGNF